MAVEIKYELVLVCARLFIHKQNIKKPQTKLNNRKKKPKTKPHKNSIPQTTLLSKFSSYAPAIVSSWLDIIC